MDLAGAGPIVLVGCGKMGSALLSGWLAHGLPRERAHVVEPALDPARATAIEGVAMLADAGDLPAGLVPAVVVFAVKPQAMAEVAPLYAGSCAAGAFALSIAAGQTIADFERYLGADAAIVRVMPNTPAAIGRGMSVCCANAAVTSAQRETAGALMAAVGETAWIEDEALMDAVTAVSGSGPAYVFLLIESLAAAGIEQGLAPDLALRMARATVAGAGALAQGADEAPAQLRINVTSPGGTTAAALEVLMGDRGLEDLMRRAVDAATRRGRELAG